MTTRDRNGQVLLATFLEAYAANPHRTEGNLPGGGRLFETCTRAVEPEPTQAQLDTGEGGSE